MPYLSTSSLKSLRVLQIDEFSRLASTLTAAAQFGSQFYVATGESVTRFVIAQWGNLKPMFLCHLFRIYGSFWFLTFFFAYLQFHEQAQCILISNWTFRVSPPFVGSVSNRRLHYINMPIFIA